MKKCDLKKCHSFKYIFIVTGVALAILGGWLGKKMIHRSRTF
ncbi:MAG: hypothetical protein WCU00_03545 [Candidatus Latescibacterota bacterium]